jgi:hypothetical protein
MMLAMRQRVGGAKSQNEERFPLGIETPFDFVNWTRLTTLTNLTALWNSLIPSRPLNRAHDGSEKGALVFFGKARCVGCP